MQGRPIDFRFHEFRLDYEQNKRDVFKAVYSDPFSAGGHMWKIKCYPRGMTSSDSHRNLYVFVQLESQPRLSSVSAIFDVFLMDKDGKPTSTFHRMTGVHLFRKQGWVNSRYLAQADLTEYHVKDGYIRILCGIMVVNDDSSIPVPPSNIVEHLGNLLDIADGADVSFIVGNETFHAHRALLAARSPMSSITLHDIAPATFKLMLRFMYTDTFPGDAELGGCPSEMIRHLLAAADRYALDRLKLFCAQKLWDIVSVETVGATLACAEMYNCSELKIKCIDFFALEKNFRQAVLTDGFVQLVQQFPSIIAELRERPVA
ncbi:hypothetical protein BDA96_07G211600 [Sorghum bicolor]|uniref:BTB domain-containing protein n=2 Tax=Sorghum bicolor TaxID=4558 RepID=A0A1B6PIQ9_SORBI|nr:hypothetical protein BDA96_07G211600 [Sorghum bicolor]KXG25570.1 hypothetical protein SORBI_3007G199000 [Sorghum bicolor]